MSSYKVQVCRSHELSSTPRPWETKFEGSETEAVKFYWERLGAVGASGDQVRVVDAEGLICGLRDIEQTTLSKTRFGMAS